MCRQCSWGVEKGDTVWYYTLGNKSWRRGKVVNVNRYGLRVKDFSRHEVYFVGPEHTVVHGYLAKPAKIPKEWYEVTPEQRQFRYEIRADNEKTKLYKKLGISV